MKSERYEKSTLPQPFPSEDETKVDSGQAEGQTQNIGTVNIKETCTLEKSGETLGGN